MATIMNTTKSIKKASTALDGKCKETKENMDSLLANAGIDPKKVKMVDTYIPLVPGDNDDVVFVGLNGSKFYFRRGETLSIPEPCVEIMRHCHII